MLGANSSGSFLPISKRLLSAILAGIGVVLGAIPASAAEKVILNYSVLQASIAVSELRTLADTGEASPSLKSYLKKANTKPEELQETLTKEVEVDAVQLSKTLNSIPGEFLLDRASEIVHTPSERASRQSLRGAIVRSAIDDDKVNIIEVLENYPTNEVYVEGDRLVELYKTIDSIATELSDLETIIDKL